MSFKAHPINGFRQDFDKFHSDFLAAKSLRFRVFAEVWRKRKFSFLLYGRETLLKTHDFIECLFYQLLDYTQPPHEIETQVCAFYMLYGFYFKQPIKGRVRIRVTNKEWPFILKLETVMRREGHWDLVYVFHALCSAKAFHFCATRQPYFPNAPIYAFLSDDHLQLSSGKPLSAILGQERLQMLEDIHQRYQVFKQAIPSQQKGKVDTQDSGERSRGDLTSDLNLVRPNYFKNLIEKVRKDDEHLKLVEEEYRSQQLIRARSRRKVGRLTEMSKNEVLEDQEEEEMDQMGSSDDQESNLYTISGREETEALVEAGQPSNSSQKSDEDEHWRNRNRRSSSLKARVRIAENMVVEAAEEKEDLSELPIGERRKRLKESHYGALISPVKSMIVRPKRKRKAPESS